jgi:hypothetical protein
MNDFQAGFSAAPAGIRDTSYSMVGSLMAMTVLSLCFMNYRYCFSTFVHSSISCYKIVEVRTNNTDPSVVTWVFVVAQKAVLVKGYQTQVLIL